MNKKPFVMIINGSPRPKGNCVSMINDITERLVVDYKIYNLYDMNIEYCTACGYCSKTGKCKYKDDMEPMYRDFDECIGVIVLSPVNFDCITAKLKTLVDRTNSFYASKYILNKPAIDRQKPRFGLYIAVGGSKPYPSQFKGGDIVMDFFFKSVNTRLGDRKYHVPNTDALHYSLNADVKIKLFDAISDFNNLINHQLKDYSILSKFTHMILHHQPEFIGIKLDKRGFVNIDEFIDKMKGKGFDINKSKFKEIIKYDDGQKFIVTKDKTKFRLKKQNSDKDLVYKECYPDCKLYHGTQNTNMNSISEVGLCKGKGLFVHMTDELTDAKKYAMRRKGDVVVLEIDVPQMVLDGHRFYISESGVWLTDNVPKEYISICFK